MVAGGFQLVATQAKTLCSREIQPILIKIEMSLLIISKRRGDFFDGFELSFIQFYALALNSSHASCIASIAFSALCFAARLPYSLAPQGSQYFRHISNQIIFHSARLPPVMFHRETIVAMFGSQILVVSPIHSTSCVGFERK